MKRLALLASCSLVATGCATGPQLHHTSPDLMVGSMGSTTRFEREMARPLDTDDGQDQKATKALFWTGVVLGVVGTVGVIGFAAAGAATDNKLSDGFDDGLTVDEERDLRQRGKTFNRIAIGSLVTALVGGSLAAIVYGIDYTRCGPLAEKRRKCAELRSE